MEQVWHYLSNILLLFLYWPHSLLSSWSFPLFVHFSLNITSPAPSLSLPPPMPMVPLHLLGFCAYSIFSTHNWGFGVFEASIIPDYNLKFILILRDTTLLPKKPLLKANKGCYRTGHNAELIRSWGTQPASTDTTIQLLHHQFRKHCRSRGRKTVRDTIPKSLHKQVQNNNTVNGDVNMGRQNFMESHS